MGDMEGHRCNPEMNLNFDKEFYKQISEENENMFGCSVPFHPSINSSKSGMITKICDNATQGIKAFTHYDESRDTVWTPEFTPCAVFNIFFGLPSMDDTGNSMKEAYIRLYMKTEIKVKSIVLYYDSTTFVSQIGGCVGILLGISMVDIVKMFNSSFITMINKIFK